MNFFYLIALLLTICGVARSSRELKQKQSCQCLTVYAPVWCYGESYPNQCFACCEQPTCCDLPDFP